ncbi:MAG: type IV pilus modification protein PilV [Pseudomonadales bacterium]
MPKLHGFSLLEVLVAMTLLALGVLGMGGLQLSVLRAQQGSLERTQATLLAEDLLERAWLNPGQSYVLGFDAEPPSSVDCQSQSCTPAQLRRFDQAQWLQALANALPEGDGAVEESGLERRVTVRWREKPDSPLVSLSLLTLTAAP